LLPTCDLIKDPLVDHVFLRLELVLAAQLVQRRHFFRLGQLKVVLIQMVGLEVLDHTNLVLVHLNLTHELHDPIQPDNVQYVCLGVVALAYLLVLLDPLFAPLVAFAALRTEAIRNQCVDGVLGNSWSVRARILDNFSHIFDVIAFVIFE